MRTIILNPFRTFLRNEAPEGGLEAGGNSIDVAEPRPVDDSTAVAEDSNDIDFSLDDVKAEQVDSSTVDNEVENQSEEYVLELSEEFLASDEFKSMATEQAKLLGIDGKVAGKYVSGVVASMQQAEAEAIKASTGELKEEWGRDFNANMIAVKQFSAKICAASGLTAEDLVPLQSPKGFKLLHALMKSTGESGFAGSKSSAGALAPADEARAMLTDPSHSDYIAINDPSNPRHIEANRKYNRLVGLT